MSINSFLSLPSRSVDPLSPLASFVPISSYPVEIHGFGGVFHHAFSHCSFARHILHALLRDLSMVGPHSSGEGAIAQRPGTLFRVRDHRQHQPFAIHALLESQPESL